MKASRIVRAGCVLLFYFLLAVPYALSLWYEVGWLAAALGGIGLGWMAGTLGIMSADIVARSKQ